MEINAGTIGMAAGIIALIFAVAAFYRSGQPLTLQGMMAVADNTKTLAEEINEVSLTGVIAAQQLKERDEISNDEALQHAVDHVEKWMRNIYPNVDLDPEVLINVVEAAYHGIKSAQVIIGNAAYDTPAGIVRAVDAELRRG